MQEGLICGSILPYRKEAAKLNFVQKDQYDWQDLMEIVRLLRDPENGCPWDKVQTHESLRMNFIEETYEVVDAIDQKDPDGIKEELGDILLQVMTHVCMEEEAGRFNLQQVCDGICKKLIFRHPHIFGNATASTEQQVLDNWNELKKQEKGQKTLADQLDAVPKALPALMRAEKISKRAGKAGLDYADAAAAMADLVSEVEELAQAVDPESQKDELGDVLFAAVNTARMMGIDAEDALGRSAEKFVRRAKLAEQLAQGQPLAELTPERLDQLWKDAKKRNP